MSTAAELSDIDDDDEVNALAGIPNSPERAHPPLSPATPAESFFLSPKLKSSQVSGFALAAEIRRSRSNLSMATDEFATAASIGSHHNSPTPLAFSADDNLFGKDVLVHSRGPIADDYDDDHLDFKDSHTFSEDEKTMMKSSTKTSAKASKKSNTPTQADDKTPDAAMTVYDTVKNVWTWGKDVPILGFGEGIVESVAGKILSVAGTSLPELDKDIKPHVTSLDTKFLNPAIDAIVSTIMKGVSKGDDMIRPVIEKVAPTVLGTLGMIEDDKKKPTPETAPEVTAPAPAVK